MYTLIPDLILKINILTLYKKTIYLLSLFTLRTISTMESRKDHLALCKQRALEYAERNELGNAVASMLSDL